MNETKAPVMGPATRYTVAIILGFYSVFPAQHMPGGARFWTSADAQAFADFMNRKMFYGAE